MRFSSVKIEKLSAVPEAPLPNQFYLIEVGGGTRFYISDTNSNLHLLNESPSSIYVNTNNSITLTTANSGSIITDLVDNTILDVTLPPTLDGVEFEFWVVYGNGIRIYTNSGTEFIKIGAIHKSKLKSIVDTSAIRIYAFNGHWRVRSLVGEWETEEVITYNGNPVVYNTNPVTYI